MLNSVRIRLTLWYTAAMTLVLVVLAATTYVVLRQNVVRRAERKRNGTRGLFSVDGECRTR